MNDILSRERVLLIEARDKVHSRTISRMEGLWDALNGRSEVPEDFPDRFWGQIAKINEARSNYAFDLMVEIIIDLDDLMHISSEAYAKRLLEEGKI